MPQNIDPIVILLGWAGVQTLFTIALGLSLAWFILQHERLNKKLIKFSQLEEKYHSVIQENISLRRQCEQTQSALQQSELRARTTSPLTWHERYW